MVNTGKPSQGCYMCRARRIKCDEAKPHCMRCQKSKRICPGYRDAFELNLRDETKTTKKKMSRMLNHRSFIDGVSPFHGPVEFNNSATTSLIGPPMTASNFDPYNSSVPQLQHWEYIRSYVPTSSISSFNSLPSFATSMTQPVDNTDIIAYHSGCMLDQLSVPVDQQAACFFLSNFVLVPHHGTLRGYLNFALPYLGSQQANPAVKWAFQAVALAAFGTRPNSKSLLPQADAAYYTALKEINATLKDPRMSTDDTTLAAILMLSMFEQIMAPRKSHEGWSSHIDGAIALLKSRGPENFLSPDGQEVWNTVRALMVVQKIVRADHVDMGEEWWMSVPAKDGNSNAFARLNIRVANLRGDYRKITTSKSRTASDHEVVLRVLEKAKRLDKEYANWFESLEGPWATSPINWIDYQVPDLESSFVHPGRVDYYSEMWMAYHHNIGRSSRLFIWTTILRCVARLSGPQDYRLTAEYETASQVCRQLVEDTVASVPYIFGWNKENDDSMADKSSFACGSTNAPTVKSLWAIFVMFPLFAASVSDFVLPSERTFLRGKLKYINEVLGIHQASVLLRMPVMLPSSNIALERHQLNSQPYDSRTGGLTAYPKAEYANLAPQIDCTRG